MCTNIGQKLLISSTIFVSDLKRFSPSERYRKLSATVEFPITNLDMSPYSSNKQTCTYNLYAVSNHSGTAYSGHYTAYCLHSGTKQWYEFNDSRYIFILFYASTELKLMVHSLELRPKGKRVCVRKYGDHLWDHTTANVTNIILMCCQQDVCDISLQPTVTENCFNLQLESGCPLPPCWNSIVSILFCIV